MEYKVSDGYSAARNMNVIVCGLGMAWSALQFELKTLKTDTFGELDLSGASIPLLCVAVISYYAFRTVIEYMMQSVEVRRWKYAQLDFKSIFWLTQVSLTLLAASAVHRSFETLAYVALAWVAIPISVILLTVIAYAFTFPIILLIGKLKKRTSVASMAFEGLAWATVLIILLILLMILGGSVAIASYEPIRSLWSVPPSALNTGLFAVAAISVTFMMFGRENLFIHAFSMSRVTVHERDHTGRPTRVTIGNKPPITTDWYQVPKDESASSPGGARDA